jgi:segregation and condensation protein B
LFATTRQFLDDLGLASLDQLPLLSQVDSPLSALTALTEVLDEPPAQASLSLEAALSDVQADTSTEVLALSPEASDEPLSTSPPTDLDSAPTLNGEDTPK